MTIRIEGRLRLWHEIFAGGSAGRHATRLLSLRVLRVLACIERVAEQHHDAVQTAVDGARQRGPALLHPLALPGLRICHFIDRDYIHGHGLGGIREDLQ